MGREKPTPKLNLVNTVSAALAFVPFTPPAVLEGRFWSEPVCGDACGRAPARPDGLPARAPQSQSSPGKSRQFVAPAEDSALAADT